MRGRPFDRAFRGQSMCGCPGGSKLCVGACANVKHDPQNCGDCNVMCAPEQNCVNGNCQSSKRRPPTAETILLFAVS